MEQKKLLAIEYLAGGAAATKAASAAGVSRATLCRWQKDLSFQDEVRRSSAAMMEELGRRIVFLSSRAFDVLEEVLNDPVARRGERIRSASTILSNFASLRELLNLEERIKTLEEVRHETDQRTN